jgi:hypothetical protein
MGGTPMTSMTPMKSGNPSAAAQLGPNVIGRPSRN